MHIFEKIQDFSAFQYQNSSHLSNDFSAQDFSVFQHAGEIFPMNNNQFSTEPFQEEQFSPGFLGPQDSSSFL